MLKNFFIIAWRNLLRHKSFSLINIFGLAIGIACCILVGLFIMDELSFDKQNKDANRIHRVVKDFVNDDGSRLPDATTPPAIAAAAQKEIPEIECVTRLFPGWGTKFYVRHGDKKFIEENIYRADSSLFEVFTFPVIKGDVKTALSTPNTIILTESMAKKYFDNDDPMGKTLEIDNETPPVVSAIIKDVPDNSHFKFDFLIPLKFNDDKNQPININSIWGWYNYYTYIKLKPGANITSVDKKIRAIFSKNRPDNKNYFYTQPLTAIHLSSNLKWELRPNSDKTYVYVFGTIAIFILLIACINYVNLTTARSTLRAKEIGIRKVSGAVKGMLIRQFLAESVLMTLISSLLALIISQLLLPTVNQITGKSLTLIPSGNYLILFAVFAFTVLIGLIAGFYPALYLSSFEPVKVLKGEKLSGLKNLSLRKILVVTQFSISITLIIGTIIVMQQINFIQTTKLGLNKDNVVVLNDIGYLSKSDRSNLKNELLKVAGVKKVAAADGVVGGQNWTNGVRYKESKISQLVNFLNVDGDYIDALGMELKEGRSFSPEHPSDTSDAIILNETAVRQLGVPVPSVGKQIVWDEDLQSGKIVYATIIGVVKDFHFTSMKNQIKPFVFLADNNRQANFNIKLDGTKTSQAISAIQKVWNQNVKSRPFQFSFLDDTYAKLYKSEMNFKTVFFCVTFIGIFIACLGLFGLSSFITQQRTKEIGIRKVLGASVPGIVGMLSKDFVGLVLISSIIAFPLAWWAMHSWLQDFVYRVDIKWWVFALAAIIALIIALVTISSQAIKAGIANPVKSLRTE